MTILGRLLEQRTSHESPSWKVSNANLATLLGGGPNASGVEVTEKSALKFAAVWRGTAVISSLGGSTPLHAYKAGTLEKRRVNILETPHPDMTSYEFWRLNYVHRVLWGNSFCLKVKNGAGALVELHPIAPERVRVVAVGSTEANPSGKVFVVDGDLDRPLTSSDIFHIPGLGYNGVCGMSVVRMAATSIGMGLAAEEYGARLWSQGSLMSGILTTEASLDQGKADRLKASWREKIAGLSKAHEVAILDNGAKFQQLSMPNNDAQFIESRDFQVSEFSRFIGLPPFLLMQTAKSTSWGTGLEQQAIGFVKFDLHPQWFKPTEARVTKELTGAGIYAKYKIEGLLRGDSTARSAFYNVMRQVGAYSANDIRELEDLPPIDGGDTYLQPMNMEPLGTEPDPTEDDGDADAPDDAA